jgi:hypothetical protein
MAPRPKYTPGSFTKNFAWAGTGFRRLHTAIRAGYSNALSPVNREKWRADSGIKDGSLELIPINFFLHNKSGKMSVDELVFQAISRPHNIDFDRLSLFAFHLTQVGTPPQQGPQRPALWANEFAKEVLWKTDSWQSAALIHSALDNFIADTMNASEDVRIKSRNNYRYFFELAGYLPTSGATINTGQEGWITPALYLAWDRFVLDGGSEEKNALLKYVDDEELYKLIGTSKADVDEIANIVVPLYLDAGATDRFASSTPAITTPISAKKTVTPAPATPPSAASWLDEEGSDEAVGRSLGSKSLQKRNRKIASQLRLHYKHRCMFCGIRLQIGDQRFYAEAAHIKPLGSPHDGPDKTGNLLILCPNHHLQFDRGVVRIEMSGQDFKIKSSVPGDTLDGKLIKPKHALDDICVKWHFDWFSDNRKPA